MLGKVYRFVGSDDGRPGEKRQQLPRACEACRRRKKKCNHFPEPSRPWPSGTPRRTPREVTNSAASSPDPTTSEAHQESSPALHQMSGGLERHNGGNAPSSQHSSPPRAVQLPAWSLRLHQERERDQSIGRSTPARSRSPQTVQNQQNDQHQQNLETLDSRFIGDLNPESVFLAATSPDATRGISMNDSVGVWRNSTLGHRVSVSSPHHQPTQPAASLFYGSSSVQNVIPLLEQECISTLPPPTQVMALSRIYFERIHPIFPVIDEVQLRSLPEIDPGRILLEQSICLAASKNFFAADAHLTLKGSNQLLSCREFGDKVSGAMRLSIEMGLVNNKIILIQALALLSQFIDGPDGGEMSSQLCAKAIHHVHSIGLHVKGHQREPRDQYGATLLCCIWAIDRMNAAFNGRPVLMHDRDMRQDFEQCVEQQEPCFRLTLHVVLLLDKVIGLYRPSILPDEQSLDGTYPSFEDLVVGVGGSQIGMTAISTIETLYHAITILSCRSKVWAEPQRSSVSYFRQRLSASILSSTANQERDQLVLFPFVPYAMSLSLSIAYREMRHNKVSLYRSRARTQFRAINLVLSDLGEVFRSASTTASMGEKLLKEIDRVVSVVALPEEITNSLTQFADIAMDVQQGLATSGAEHANSNEPLSEKGADQAAAPLHNFDPAFFDPISDVDLFSMFDPAFGLDDFDAYLEGTLNPYFPANEE